ncbi:hypothetical protein HDV00_000366 [Rhizophlyctis rosea]|nr:hypothetical protein HDV00_000366 [Rhizophlyctis rosea]
MLAHGSAIHKHIRQEHYEKAVWLIDHGADINKVNTCGSYRGRTPIAAAVNNRTNLPFLKLLFERGARLDGRALRTAGTQDRDEIDINSGQAYYNTTAIQDAKSWRKVAMLLRAGADHTLSVAHGTTILHKAEMWLRNGDGMRETPSEEEEFPITYEEAWKQKRECVKVLLAKGLDVDARDSAGPYSKGHLPTPLDLALKFKSQPGGEEWVKILVDFEGVATSPVENDEVDEDDGC